jgi:hypothetical protein
MLLCQGNIGASYLKQIIRPNAVKANTSTNTSTTSTPQPTSLSTQTPDDTVPKALAILERAKGRPDVPDQHAWPI